MKKQILLFALLAFVSCKQQHTRLSTIKGERILLDVAIKEDASIKKAIAPYKENLESDMKKVLTFAPVDFVKNDGKLQSTLGNLMADLCYEMANPIYNEKTQQPIDFVLFNNGGLRAPISEGKVTTENAFMLMPFENELVVAQLSGANTEALFQFFINNRSAHPISKQVQIILGAKEPRITIHGKPFQKDKSYNVLTSDYLLNGGDDMTFFANPEKVEILDYKVRDAIIDYFKKVDTLKPILDNRVIVK